VRLLLTCAKVHSRFKIELEEGLNQSLSTTKSINIISMTLLSHIAHCDIFLHGGKDSAKYHIALGGFKCLMHSHMCESVSLIG
jgi:hypothetical protein